MDRHGGVGVEQIARLLVDAGDLLGGAGLARAQGVEFAADLRQRRRVDAEAPALRLRAHEAANGGGVAPIGVEQQALEIGGDLNVHGGRGGRVDALHLIGAAVEGAGQDVVLVGGDDEPIDGQAHLLGDIARENVAEIARWDRVGDLAVRAAQHGGAGEIIDRLRHHPRPVDGIDARQAQTIAEAVVVEEALQDRLAIIEGAFQRDGVNVWRLHRGHLAALHVGDAPVRIHDEHIHLLEPTEGLDGGGAGVA